MFRRAPWMLLAACLVGFLSCAHVNEADQRREMAKRAGKYRVRLTEDAESVQGTCKFVRYIEPDYDPVRRPTLSELDDYYRVEAVLLGADTVLVGTGKVGEAYICGPGALNPDGTVKRGYSQPPSPSPHP